MQEVAGELSTDLAMNLFKTQWESQFLILHLMHKYANEAS